MKTPDITVQKLVLLSLMKIFKDIIPGYRLLEEDEDGSGGTMLSTEVRSRKLYETTLLASYQNLLNSLRSWVNSKSQPLLCDIDHQTDTANALKNKDGYKPLKFQAQLGMGRIAVRALSELLQDQYHFNFHNEIIKMLVPVLDFPAEGSEVSLTSMNCISPHAVG